jgi:hypothetical protein
MYHKENEQVIIPPYFPLKEVPITPLLKSKEVSEPFPHLGKEIDVRRGISVKSGRPSIIFTLNAR